MQHLRVLRAPAAAFLFRCFLLSVCHFGLGQLWLLQLSAMDVSVRSTMKGAAKCDKHCELQNSVNRQGLERILCFWDIPESTPASVSTLCCSSSCRPSRGMLLAISCASGRAFLALLRRSMDKALRRQPAYRAHFPCPCSLRDVGSGALLSFSCALASSAASHSIQDMKSGWQTR